MPSNPEAWRRNYERRLLTGNKITDARRKKILAAWPECYVCGVNKSTEVDHVIPVSLGGRPTDRNLKGICFTCHLAKSERERIHGIKIAAARRRALKEFAPPPAPVD